MNNIRKAKWFVPVLVTLAAMMMAGGILASLAVSGIWTSPQVVVTNPAPLPTLRSLVIGSTWAADGAVTTGSNFDFPVTLTNPSDAGAATYNNVTIDIKIWNVNPAINIAATDLTLEYYDGSTYQVIPTTAVNSSGIKQDAVFGPATGFPVAPGYNATTQFRVVFHTAGTYQASAQAQTP